MSHPSARGDAKSRAVVSTCARPLAMAVVVVDVQVEERRADCADVYTTWDAEDWQFLRHR